MSIGVNANALDVKGKLEAGVGLYDSIPMGDTFKDAAKSAMGFNIYADYKVMDNVTAGVELSNSFGYEVKANSSVDYTNTMIGVRGKYVKPMDFGTRKGKVYGILGIANYNWNTDPKMPGVDSENDLGFSLGGGIDLEITSQIIAGFELRYHVVNNENNLAPMVKVGYCF